MWRYLLRPVLFSLQPEAAHHYAMGVFAAGMAMPGLRRVVETRCRVDAPQLTINRFGIEFSTPVGLSAGFDKDAKWFGILAALGFGFIEVGTITARAQPGNPQPRLFRLIEDRALINRLGNNNQGAIAVAERLRRQRLQCVLGINIGRSTEVPNEQSVADYLESFERLYAFASYFTINVSCSNVRGFRKLQEGRLLRDLLLALTEHNVRLAEQTTGSPKPILLKISPDLNDREIDEIAAVSLDVGLQGIIAANTTTSRDGLQTPGETVRGIGSGGLSGPPLMLRSRRLVARLFRMTEGKLTIIGSGGIMSGEDAWQMIRAGASLVQVYTGFIYEGPGFPCSITRYLRDRLVKGGKSTIEEVIGEAAEAFDKPVPA